jgi:Tfp pilus assembly protein PilN
MLAPSNQACAPWCVEHRGGMCFSQRRWARSAYTRLARLLDGRITVMVSVPDLKGHGRDGLIQVSAHDARDLADVLRALGHVDLFKAVKFTVHEADAFSQF